MINLIPGSIRRIIDSGMDKNKDLTGEQIVMEYLKNKGFSVGSENDDIEAKGDKSKFIVHVKSSVTPKMPINLSPAEEESIKQKAEKLGYEAWEAKVQLSKKQLPVGEIQWRKIK